MSFPTQEAKDAEATKVFSDLKNKYSGSTEGEIASYYLASIQADQGNMAQAEKSFQEVAQHAEAGYASLAKLSLWRRSIFPTGATHRVKPFCAI